MKANSLSKTCSAEANDRRPVACDWGHQYFGLDEITALRIAYAHRYAKHGVEAKQVADGSYMVVLFNELGAQFSGKAA